jgi:hypothetical protein
MALIPPFTFSVPGFVPLAYRLITCSVTRDGELTGGTKVVRIAQNPANPIPSAVFFLKDGLPVTQKFALNAMVGEWIATAMDTSAEPKLGGVKFITVNQDLTISFDLTEGDTSNPGSPGVIDALVKVNAQPASRHLVAVELATDGHWRLVGEGESGAAGDGTLEVKVTASAQVYVMAIDNWGVPFQPNAAVEVGSVIRPVPFRGWLYTISEAGQLPSVEPEWWVGGGDNPPRQVGTARAVAGRYYQPLAHGPLPVDLT